MSDEQAAVDAEVEVEFASPVLGRERGTREVLARSPYLDAVIREGHVRVVREVGAPPAALVGVPAPAPVEQSVAEAAEPATAEPEVPTVEPAPRKGRGGSR